MWGGGEGGKVILTVTVGEGRYDKLDFWSLVQLRTSNTCTTENNKEYSYQLNIVAGLRSTIMDITQWLGHGRVGRYAHALGANMADGSDIRHMINMQHQNKRSAKSQQDDGQVPSLTVQ